MCCTPRRPPDYAAPRRGCAGPGTPTRSRTRAGRRRGHSGFSQRGGPDTKVGSGRHRGNVAAVRPSVAAGGRAAADLHGRRRGEAGCGRAPGKPSLNEVPHHPMWSRRAGGHPRVHSVHRTGAHPAALATPLLGEPGRCPDSVRGGRNVVTGGRRLPGTRGDGGWRHTIPHRIGTGSRPGIRCPQAEGGRWDAAARTDARRLHGAALGPRSAGTPGTVPCGSVRGDAHRLASRPSRRAAPAAPTGVRLLPAAP